MSIGNVPPLSLLPLLFVASLPFNVSAADISLPHPARISHHSLTVELIPASHELIARDDIEIRLSGSARELTFTLAPTLKVESVTVVASSGKSRKIKEAVVFATERPSSHPASQRITVQLPHTDQKMLALGVTYRGTISDPPREPRHLRFVTPSETAGHIGQEGVYLSGETQWYPDIAGSLATFRATVTTPDGWIAVTHGRERSRKQSTSKSFVAEWEVNAKTEALTLVANKFMLVQRDWKDGNGPSVQVATYFLPENASLANEYLDASVKYLEVYSELLGPYPFPKFAVVENFFASGLGMPSFTLLGSGVIKRHYVQPYALGHEIVHSWIGNSVFNQTDKGNWVEGLTTYLANYYYHELTGDDAQARDQRRLMLYGYSVYVKPEQDYPVGSFTHKSDEKDNAIGYQKSAMVFHLLRQEIGDDAFWTGLRKLVAGYRENYAEWRDLERLFGEVSKNDLRSFFAQWVEQAGAPEVMAADVVAKPASAGERESYTVTAQVAQGSVPFRFPLQVQIKTVGGQIIREQVQIAQSQQAVVLTVPARPTTIELDPEYHLFRRIARDRLPAMLNLYVTAERRFVIPPTSGITAEWLPYEELVKRIVAQQEAKPAAQRTTILGTSEKKAWPAKGSVLVLGGPGQNPSARLAEQTCGEKLQIMEQGFTMAGVTYEGPGMATLVSCHRRENPGSIVTVFFGMSRPAIEKIARLLFFYGWQSYVVFRDGNIVARGDWEETADVTEVRVDGR